MLFLKKLSVYISSLVVLILFYLILQTPERVWHLSVIAILVLFILFKLLTVKKLTWLENLKFFILIFFLTLACLLFLLVIENFYLKYFILILTSLLTGAFFELIFVYLYRSHKYQPFSLNRYYEYVSILIFFFLSSSFFALQVFLNISFWLIGLILTLLACILFYLNLWLNKFEIKKNIIYFYILGLLTLELSLALTWLPISYYLKAFCLTIFYFLFIKFINYQLRENWNKKKVLFYVLGGVGIVLLALVTARWL
ncbi:hypothetical protein L6278_00735 [Candidatus Parcubacteria bacterium]|nr:hypothetical protein [Patescibacteria group bacterium]MBU4481850.1 hypothetical protein [Patescibacteria group bacterium]MCG2686645.1 hypothetical protein [Candidatus Parcubacteria bacterium]